MATGPMGSSSPLEFVEPQRGAGAGAEDCGQPAATCEGNLSPERLGFCAAAQLDGDPRRGEFLSSKDAARRKRVNRLAKLKQCKLDARREQWLSRGGDCRPEQAPEKQDSPQQFVVRKEEKEIVIEDPKAGKCASPKQPECHESEFLDEESIITKKNDASFFQNPYAVGSSIKGHSKITQMVKDGESVRTPLPLGAGQDGCSCKNERRPADPGKSPRDLEARDLEEARRGIANHQFCREASGDSHCAAASCCGHDLGSSRSGGLQRSSSSREALISRLDLIPRVPEFHDGGDVVGVSEKNGQRNNGRRPWSGSTDQAWPSGGSPCTSSSSAEIGSGDNGLSFTPHETEDDWEVAADALDVPASPLTKDTIQLPKPILEGKEFTEPKGKELGSSLNLQNGSLKPEYKCKPAGFGIKSRNVGGRAWRPDDVSRPPTLPRLSKQLSFPQESSSSVWSSGIQQGRNVWGRPPTPSYCPICTEELDLTDSSFLPCSCGFRLCLFCYHRILSDDGRCPGCRKTYSPDVAVKLSRSTSLWLRV